MTNVWANASDVPGVVCADARLTDRSRTRWPFTERPTTSRDQVYGQAGWDRGINFADLRDLASQIGTFQRGEIRRLAIHAHGAMGTIFVNGRRSSSTLTADTVAANHSFLHAIGLRTPDNAANPAVILFVGCLAGGGPDGTRLLLALSRVWPNRKVVAFATLGYAPGGEMSRSGDHCTEPGMRDTTATRAGEADQTAGTNWSNLTAWPWASETSPRAKVALNQRIVRGATW